jgi:hypothetical protein
MESLSENGCLAALLTSSGFFAGQFDNKEVGCPRCGQGLS